jgi:predicted phage-related endonuclease
LTVTELNPCVIGASDVPAIVGLDPYVSPYALGCRKLGLVREPPTSQAAENGLRLEQAHAAMVEDAGYDVMPAPAAGFVHPDLPWLHVHPDALIALPTRPEAVGYAPAAPLELKARGRAPDDALKTRDTIQNLMQMSVLAAPRGMVSTLHGGYGGITRTEWFVDDDAELFAMLVRECERFRALIATGKLPAPDGSDSTRDAIRNRFADADADKSIRLDTDQWKRVLAIRALDETIRRAKEQRERHAQIIQDAMGDATQAVSPVDTLGVRWNVVKSNRIDTKALREAHPALASEFTTTTTTRRFEPNP